MNTYQKIVATGLLLHEGKVLIIKRHPGEKFLPNVYELPGGKVDFGENPEEALVREYQEETKLTITVVKPLRTFSYVSDNNNRHTVEIVYLVKLLDTQPEVVLGKDHTDSKWITSQDAADYFESDDEVMNSLGFVFNDSIS